MSQIQVLHKLNFMMQAAQRIDAINPALAAYYMMQVKKAAGRSVVKLYVDDNNSCVIIYCVDVHRAVILQSRDLSVTNVMHCHQQ